MRFAPSCAAPALRATLMEHLHDVAWARGARPIRLTVAAENERARRLFESLGYEFAVTDDPVLVGFLERK